MLPLSPCRKMKVIISGASGMLGSEIADAFETDGHEVKRLLGRKELDLTSTADTLRLIEAYRPDLIIHTAGNKDVDAVERDSRSGYFINTLTTRNMALAAMKVQAKLLYTSTDAIYNGEKGTAYHEYDEPDPINVYGFSKLKGEEEVRKYCKKYYIVRLGLLFGNRGHPENNMIRQIIEKLNQGKTIEASVDQVCSPSYTKDVTAAILKLCQTDFYGEYNLANEGQASRYELTKKICEQMGYDTALVQPANAGNIKLARRPKYTAFDSINYKMINAGTMPHWEDALARCLDELRR